MRVRAVGRVGLERRASHGNARDRRYGCEARHSPSATRRGSGAASSYRRIYLRGNPLGTEGWCAIFAALRDNKENKIESWELSGQGINAEIAKVLAEYVSVSGVLTTLDLRANDLGDEGKGVIRDAVSGRVGFELKM